MPHDAQAPWAATPWPQFVTWGLIVLSVVASYFVGWAVTSKSQNRAEQRDRVDKALEFIRHLEQEAVAYWTDGLESGALPVCARSNNILRDLSRLEDLLRDIDASAKGRLDYVKLLLDFRKAITSGPWQSQPRPPLPANDPRIQAIGESAAALEKAVNKAK